MRLVCGLAAAVLLAGAPAARLDQGFIGESAAQRAGRRAQPARVRGLSAAAAGRGRARRHPPRDARPDLPDPDLLAAHRRARPRPARRPARHRRANPPFAPYRARHLTPALIDRGRARYAENCARLDEIGRRYGVPPQYLIAIWGKETSYGSIMGDFDLLNSLASLAYEGRRRAALHRRVHRHPAHGRARLPARPSCKGSWAGAAGHPQFLPSVYLRLAVDGDGDGRADIWRSHLDALASIANYLRNAGWRPGLPWGTAVRVPAGFDRAAVANRLRAPRCPPVYARHSRWLTAAEWRRRGIAKQPAGQRAGLAARARRPGRAPLICSTNNYRVILDYNCSNFYALTVALLADSVRADFKDLPQS